MKNDVGRQNRFSGHLFWRRQVAFVFKTNILTYLSDTCWPAELKEQSHRIFFYMRLMRFYDNKSELYVWPAMIIEFFYFVVLKYILKQLLWKRLLIQPIFLKSICTLMKEFPEANRNHFAGSWKPPELSEEKCNKIANRSESLLYG
jgi:hypothetical protein